MAEFSTKVGGGEAVDPRDPRPLRPRPASIMLSQSDINYVRSGGATHTFSEGLSMQLKFHHNTTTNIYLKL